MNNSIEWRLQKTDSRKNIWRIFFHKFLLLSNTKWIFYPRSKFFEEKIEQNLYEYSSIHNTILEKSDPNTSITFSTLLINIRTQIFLQIYYRLKFYKIEFYKIFEWLKSKMDSNIWRIKFSRILSYLISFKCVKLFLCHDDAVRWRFFSWRQRIFPFLLLHLATSVSLPFERFPLSGRSFFFFSFFFSGRLLYFIRALLL